MIKKIVCPRCKGLGVERCFKTDDECSWSAVVDFDICTVCHGKGCITPGQTAKEMMKRIREKK